MAIKKRKSIELDGFYPIEANKKAVVEVFVKSYTEVQEYTRELVKLDKEAATEGADFFAINEKRIALVKSFVKPNIAGGKIWDYDTNKEVPFEPKHIDDLDFSTVDMLSDEISGVLGK